MFLFYLIEYFIDIYIMPFFDLKSVLCNISVATPDFFGYYLHRISFCTLSLSTCLSLDLK